MAMALSCSAPMVHRPLPVARRRSHSWRPIVRADAADLVSLSIRQKVLPGLFLLPFISPVCSRLPLDDTRHNTTLLRRHRPTTTPNFPIYSRPSPLPTDGLLQRARLLLPIDWVDIDNDNDTTIKPRNSWRQTQDDTNKRPCAAPGRVPRASRCSSLPSLAEERRRRRMSGPRAAWCTG